MQSHNTEYRFHFTIFNFILRYNTARYFCYATRKKSRMNDGLKKLFALFSRKKLDVLTFRRNITHYFLPSTSVESSRAICDMGDMPSDMRVEFHHFNSSGRKFYYSYSRVVAWNLKSSPLHFSFLLNCMLFSGERFIKSKLLL
jgi:hypothetical protein